ncbi:hypothetical protein, partial [Lewinella sp. W8]|uniref:hypothetical protein n=1 Tax=Lewinella sp. W8 TaxID=2528208 RepID=UPI00156641A0
DFAPENWGRTISADENNDQIATIDFGEDEIVFTTTGNPDFFDFAQPFEASVNFQFGEAGTVSLDYDFNGADPGFDFAAVIYTFEGDLVEAPLFFESSAVTGTATTEVEPGYVIIMGILDDGYESFSGEESVFVVNNFSFTPPESPLRLDNFETCWGVVNAEDKTPPAVVTTPDDVELLCTDLEAISLT